MNLTCAPTTIPSSACLSSTSRTATLQLESCVAASSAAIGEDEPVHRQCDLHPTTPPTCTTLSTETGATLSSRDHGNEVYVAALSPSAVSFGLQSPCSPSNLSQSMSQAQPEACTGVGDVKDSTIDDSDVQFVDAVHVPRRSERVRNKQSRTEVVQDVQNIYAGQGEEDNCDEDADDDALWPLADGRCRVCVTDGSDVLQTSLDASTCSKKTYKVYLEEIKGMYGAEKRPSDIHGHGLFVKKDVPAGCSIIEYTGIRRSGASARALHRAFDYRGLCPNGLVSVSVDKGEDECIIDPRKCGNDAKFINHSCDPNCILMTVQVRDRYIVKVLAVVPISAGTEATVNFGRRTRAARNRVACNCKAPVCSGFLWA